MATEIDIPESILLKEVKTEENAFSSESLEEKVRELVDNKVKHLETSNLVAEPVNTKLDTGIMTNESETFFQAPSVPTVTADELSKTPETSKDTPKQEDQEEIKVTKIEALTDEKPVHDVLTQTEREVETIGNEDKNDGKAIQINEETQEKEQALNTLEKDQVADSKEQDLNEMPREFVKKETEDAQKASEQCENGPKEEREQKPEESVKNIVLSTAEVKQEEKAEFPGDEIVEEVKQHGLLHEEKGEEATQSDDGQKEKSENPLIAEVCEENSSEKIEYKASTPIATVNKDEAEEKEKDVNVLENNQGKDEVTSIHDMMPEGGLEETKHQGDCNEAEVIAKEGMEKETEDIIYSVGTPENIEPKCLNNVIPTDVSITAHTNPEDTMQNEEQDDVEASDIIKDGETKDSGSSMVKEICEEPVSDKGNTEEGLRPSESSNKESIENDVVGKDEGQQKNDVECSQDEPSTRDLEVKTDEAITNDEKATEKEASDETGPVKSESEVGLEVSGSMEPTKVEVLSTIEKNQGNTDGVISSQDATCEDIIETESGENESTVAYTEELNETPREFKEEAEGKSIDKASYHSENKAEEKLVERPDESLNEIEQKEEIEDIRPSVVLEEKLIQVETWEHEEKVEAEATHSDDGQTEKFENPAVTKVCEDNSSEKVESESSSMMPNEQVTSILSKDEDEKEQEVTVVEKDQGEESVTNAQDVPFQGCLKETNHDSEGMETEVVNAKGSVEEDSGEIKSSAETLEEKEPIANPTDVSITTQTKQEEETIGNEEKNDEKVMKSDYGETKESGSPIVSEICEETVSHDTESGEGLKVSDNSSTETNEHEIASKDETRAHVQDREEDDVTFSQAATSIEDLRVGNKENIINEETNAEEAIEKEPCEDTGLKVSDSMEPSVQEAFGTEEKDDQGDTGGVPRSQGATCVDVKETSPNIVGDCKELSETPRELIKEETEDETIAAQETIDDYESKAEDKLLERSDERVKEIEKEKETEEMKSSVVVEEKLEKRELLQGVITDASISTQTEFQDEIAEPHNADEEEASQSDDSQKEKYDNSSTNEVCEEISSEKDNQGDTDGVPRSQDATCVDVKETTPTIELSETPREFIKEETEDKTIDAQETNDDYASKAEDKLLERSDESVKEIEKEEETEEIKPSVVVEETLEKSELLQGVATDTSISTQTEPQDEIAEPDNKDEEEASQSDDGQKEKYDDSSINEVCEEISSQKVASESSSVKLNEIETSTVNKDKNEEKEQEVIVLEKDQGEDGVTSAQNVPSEGCLEEANHNSEFVEPEVVDAKGSIDDAAEEIRSSVKTTGGESPETELKNDGEAIKSDDGQVEITLNEICEETISHITESKEGPTVFDTSSKETNEHKLASKDEPEEKNQEQEEDDVTVSQSATSLEDLKVEDNDTIINEKANEKVACEDMGTDSVESGVSLITSDNIEPSVKEALSTVEKEQDDTDGVPSSQDETHEDTEIMSTIVSDAKEQNEMTREFIKDETEDKTSVVQEANDDCEDEAEEKLVEQPVESFKEVVQEEETEENRPSVKIEETLEQNDLSRDVTTDASILTQTKSQVEITEPEEKDVPQGEEGVTSAKEEVPSESCLEQTSHDNEFEAKNAQGSVEDDTKEIISGVETLEEGATEKKEKDDEVAIKSEASQTKESGIPIVEEICEETVSHSTESEEGLKVSDISSKEKNEHEQASKDEAAEKEQDQEEDDVTCSHDATSIQEFQEKENESTIKEDKNDEMTIEKEASEETNTENVESEVGLKHSDDKALGMIEKDQGNLDGVPSSQDATTVDEFKELKEEERPRELFKEETEDNLFDAQEATEKCENGAHDGIEQKPEESVKKIEQEEEKLEETNPRVEIEEKKELLCDATSDDSIISTQIKAAETIKHEEKIEEVATQSDDSLNEKFDKPSIKEVCEDEKQETVEYETSTPITVINKDEDQEHDQAVNVLEKDKGEDDVKSAQNATPSDVFISTPTILEEESKENEENNAEEVVESDDSQTKKLGSPADKETCKEIVSEEDIKDEYQETEKEIDISEKSQSGGEDVTSSQNAVNEDIKETTIAQHYSEEEGPGMSATPTQISKEETEDKSIDVQKPREYEDREMPEKIVNDISPKVEQEEYMEEVKPSVETIEEKDVCISTPTEAHEEPTQIEEKDLRNTVPDEVIDLSSSSDVNQNEKDISILSKDEVQENEQELNISEEDQGKDEVTCSQDPAALSEEELQGKYEDEDAEQKLVETREIPKEYNEVIQTSGETEEKLEQQIESKQEITEKEVCEETIKVVCKEATSEKVEPVEALELSDSSEMKINEKTITSSKDEGQEETTQIEEKNDDVIKSDYESATTVTYIEDGQDLSTMTTEILEDEAEDKSVDAQQASKESENGGKDEREQQPEESVNKQVDFCTNIVEENIKEGESDSGKKEEVDIKKQNSEAGEADGVKECETIGVTQELSPENKDEVTGSPLGDETDDQRLNKKEDQYTETEKMFSELKNLKEENVEMIPACSTEEEITEKNTKQEQCVVDGRTKEIETSTLEHEPIKEQIGGIDKVSKDKSSDPKETAEVEPQEDITPSSSIETSNSDKKKSENEDSPIEDVDSASKVQTPEVVPESNDSKLKEECVNTTARSYVEETKEIVSEGILSDEKTEQPVEIEKESVEEVCEENSTEKTETGEGGEDDKSSVAKKENPEQQGLMHVITTDVCSSAETKPDEDTVKDEDKNDELGQSKVEIVEEILEKKDDGKTKEMEDLFHDSTEDTVLDKSIEPQEDMAPSSSSDILTTHTSNSEMVNSECENFPTEEFKSVSQVQIPEVEPKTEETNLKEECVISATETHVDAELVTATKEISSDQILEPYGEKQLTHESMTDDHSEETILQQEETDVVSEKNQSVYENVDLDEEATQENQLNSAVDGGERVKDVDLTKELSYLDHTTDGIHEVKKVIVDGQIGQEDIPAAEDISCESTLVDDNIDKAPKEEEIPYIDGVATIETQVDSSNIESTACPSESETTHTQSLESVSKVIEGSEDSKVEENRIISATVEHTDVTNVEEEKIISKCISSASATKEDDNVKQAHYKSEEEKCSDLTTEKKFSTEEVDAESQTESEDIQAVEDLNSLSKASYTKEGATEDTESTPNLDLEKEEKDNGLISEVQSTPEALPKMGIKGDHPEATDEICEALTCGELNEKLVDAVKEIDTKEDIEVIAKAEKDIEESNQDAVAEVMVHEHLQQTEEALLEVEDSKESKIIDEEARCIQDSTKDTINPKWTVDTPTEVCEFTSEAAEIVTESTEASPKILLVKHDSDIETNTERIEDGIKEKDAIFQAPNLSSESGEGKQNSIADMLNKAGEVLQPQEHISSIKSDVEIKEEVELTQSGSQQTSADKKPEDSPVLLSEVKEQSEEAPVKDAQKDVDHTTKVTIVDVVNAECLNVEPHHLNTEEAMLPSVNHKNQTDEIDKADKNIDAAIYMEDVKSSDVELQSDMDVPVPICTSPRKLEVRSADLDVPSAMDTKDDKINLGSTCDKGKTTEEVSGIKQEPLELDAPVNTVATKDLDISHKDVTGDVTKEGGKLSDVKCKSAAPTKEEIADSGVKTDEENEEQEDNEDNENSGVMVEASKDMEIKVHKKSHNILSGVGSKVKHSIAKVKKAITGGKSSSPKPPSPKERD